MFLIFKEVLKKVLRSKKIVLAVFIISITFNTFHDYIFLALHDKNIQVISLQESENNSDENIDIHKILDSPFIILHLDVSLQEHFIVYKKSFSQNLILKPIKIKVFKPPRIFSV